MPDVLFSLLVPTRNRAQPAAAVIRDALRYLPGDCEVVVQDCGTDGELPPLLADLTNDPRLRYHHAGKLVPMTENWNLGIARCRGEYISITGDDDPVSRRIGRVARWAKANGIEAVSWPTLPGARYFWPDSIPGKSGTYNMYRYTGVVQKYSMAERLPRAVRVCGHMGDDLRGMPHIYHGLVRRDLVERMQVRPGIYFDGFTPDVYAQFLLATLAKDNWWVDYPVSTCGISAKSNSAVGIRAKANPRERAKWLAEFKSSDWPVLAPTGLTNQIYSVLEGICCALANAGRDDLLLQLDVPTYFAQAIYFDRPSRYLHLARYFRASASQHRGPVQATGALFRAVARRAAIRYFGAKPIPEFEEYQIRLLRQFKDIRDIGELLRMQDESLAEQGVRAPWDGPSLERSADPSTTRVEAN